MIDRDADGSGVLHGPMHNTLDADWYGVVPWLVGLYHAALRAGEEMAHEVGDREFARTCHARFESGTRQPRSAHLARELRVLTSTSATRSI